MRDESVAHRGARRRGVAAAGRASTSSTCSTNGATGPGRRVGVPWWAVVRPSRGHRSRNRRDLPSLRPGSRPARRASTAPPRGRAPHQRLNRHTRARHPLRAGRRRRTSRRYPFAADGSSSRLCGSARARSRPRCRTRSRATWRCPGWPGSWPRSLAGGELAHGCAMRMLVDVRPAGGFIEQQRRARLEGSSAIDSRRAWPPEIPSPASPPPTRAAARP